MLNTMAINGVDFGIFIEGDCYFFLMAGGYFTFYCDITRTFLEVF